MIQQFKLLSTTAVLTLLIWVGADQLLTVSDTVEVNLEFRPQSEDSAMRITPLKPAPARVKVVLSGSQRIMTSVIDQVPLRVTLHLPEQPPRAAVKLDQLLTLLRQEQAAFGNLYVESVEPSVVEVQIDSRITRPVRLVPRVPLRREYEGEPVLAPKSISAEVSELWLRSRPEPDAPLILQIDFERELGDRAAGEDFDFPVAIPIADLGPGVVADRTTVRVQGRLRQAAQQVRTLSIVPIRACLSFEDLNRPFRVRLADEFALPTQSIRVRGSEADLDSLQKQIEGGNPVIYGVVRIRPDMLMADQELSILPDFFLPPGIILDSRPEPLRLKVLPMGMESASGATPPSPSPGG